MCKQIRFSLIIIIATYTWSFWFYLCGYFQRRIDKLFKWRYKLEMFHCDSRSRIFLYSLSMSLQLFRLFIVVIFQFHWIHFIEPELKCNFYFSFTSSAFMYPKLKTHLRWGNYLSGKVSLVSFAPHKTLDVFIPLQSLCKQI